MKAVQITGYSKTIHTVLRDIPKPELQGRLSGKVILEP